MNMDQVCDFCGEQRSMVYCRSDAACLCLSCDRNVHSANALSKRHLRTLVCEQCHCQPAVVRCIEEKISLCQNCNWLGNVGPASNMEHKRQTVNCYSGCPSATEFSRIWSFFSVDESSCDPEAGSLILEEGDERPLCQLLPTDDVAINTIVPKGEQFHGDEPLNFLNQKVISDLGTSYMLYNLEYIRNMGAFASIPTAL